MGESGKVEHRVIHTEAQRKKLPNDKFWTFQQKEFADKFEIKMAESSRKGKKAQWEEKLLVKSNFSFSHCLCKRLVLQTCKNKGFFGKGLRHIFDLRFGALIFLAHLSTKC